MIVALLGCTAGPDHHPQARPDPLVAFGDPGPFGVGYRETSITWSGGLQTEPRTLRLAQWYPTDATTGDPVTYDAFLPARPEVLGDADPAQGPFPLLVYSHGHQAFAEASAFLAEHFASHGWVVLAPDHTGNTTFDGADRDTAIYWQRPLDVSAVIDRAGDELGWDLTDELVVAGHSFGGYTTHAVGGAAYAVDDLCLSGPEPDGFCSTMDPDQEAVFRGGFADGRPQALIAMAPGDADLFGAGLAQVEHPELLMTAGLDPNPESDGMWDTLGGAADAAVDRRVDVPDGGHNVFTEFSGSIDPPGAIDPEEGWRIIRTYALAFAEQQARGNPEGAELLDGTVAVSDLAELSRH